MKNKLIKIIDLIIDKKTKVLVVGDVILDVFTSGFKERISSEAPVPVVRVDDRKYIPGGAGNVAANIAKLGGEVELLSVIGEDYWGNKLQEILKSYGININRLVIDLLRYTSRKERILIGTEQIVCVADESRCSVDNWVVEKVVETLENNGSDIIVLSDYSRGMMSDGLIRKVVNIGQAQNKKVIADIHVKDNFTPVLLEGVYLFTPNRFEAAKLVNIPVADIGKKKVEIAKRLLDMLGINILMTMDGEGMLLALINGEIKEIPAIEKQPVCVSGAGDTVVGTIALALAAGVDIMDAAILSSYSAAVVVKKLGTATVTVGELKERIKNS